ncbi:hypothetical protein P3T73_12345 [Kiritimatiellota bacterium B12222]|nr:hypothetical protein P3T73_12345 [Kiritimatiellota bacterium B12222]
MFKKCEHCGEETLMLSEAIYDGFKKVGETQRCSACGKSSASQSLRSAPKKDPLAALFGEDAVPENVTIFDVEEETACMCRKCMHYVLHPFTQRCGLHDREVQAIDSCDDFVAKAQASSPHSSSPEGPLFE